VRVAFGSPRSQLAAAFYQQLENFVAQHLQQSALAGEPAGTAG
jgi:hypothetical protein